MPTSRKMRAAVAKFDARVNQRGSEMETRAKKEDDKPAISPALMYFLMFVLFGSTIFGLLQTLGQGRQF
jgi:hypothetical protein